MTLFSKKTMPRQGHESCLNLYRCNFLQTFMFHEMLGVNMPKNTAAEVECRTCNLIQVKNWPLASIVPMSTAGLIDLIKIVRELRRQCNLDKSSADLRPIVIMSQ